MADSTDPIVTSVAAPERDNMMEQLKSQLAEQTAKAAQASQQLEYFNTRERERITAFQGESQFFFNDFMKQEIEQHHAGTSLAQDVAPLGVWANEFTQKKDITSQGALAAASYVASKSIKRMREEASKLPTLQESLASSLKENEELKQNKDKLQRDYDEAIGLANERQKGLEILQEKLSQAGLMNEKFDFSKLTSREVDVEKVSEPHVGGAAAAPALETVKAEASKAAGAAMGNPIKQDDLLMSLLNRSSGGLRMNASGTQHAFLGASGGETNLIASLTAAGF
jgi:hypothetical protein